MSSARDLQNSSYRSRRGDATFKPVRLSHELIDRLQIIDYGRRMFCCASNLMLDLVWISPHPSHILSMRKLLAFGKYSVLVNFLGTRVPAPSGALYSSYKVLIPFRIGSAHLPFRPISVLASNSSLLPNATSEAGSARDKASKAP